MSKAVASWPVGTKTENSPQSCSEAFAHPLLLHQTEFCIEAVQYHQATLSEVIRNKYKQGKTQLLNEP